MNGEEVSRTTLINRPFSVDTLGTFLASILMSILSVATSILLARYLGADGKGVVTLVLLVLGQLGMVLTLGVEIALVYYAGRRKWSIEELASSSIGLSALLGTIGILLAVFIFSFTYHSLVPRNLFPVLILMTLVIPTNLITNFLQSLIRVTGRVVEEKFLGVINVFLNLVLISIALLAGLYLKGVLIALWLGSMLLGVLVVSLGFRWKLLRKPFGFSASIWSPLVKYGLKVHLGSIFQSLNYRFDIYLVAFFLGSAPVGLYSISVAMAEWLWLIPSVLGATLMQRIATIPEEQANVIIGPVNRLTSITLLVGAIVWGILGKWVIYLLYGEVFLLSYLPMLLLLPGIWAMGLWKNFMNDLSVRGYPAAKSYTSGFALFLTLILDVLLIPTWGIAGAAVASSVAYLSALMMALWYYCRITRFHPWDLLIIRRSDVAQLRAMLRNCLIYLCDASALKERVRYYDR